MKCLQTGPRELLSSSTLESEDFRIYCYKIVPCAKKFGHDWSECPFAHEGEKATRRCPALYRYSSIVCPEIRQSKACPRGDVCPYSHSIFEYWMHPARFRAQLCSFGTECNRRICFFAHTQQQLRVPSEPSVADALAARAPYLQGRVSPESRYALYSDQVPALVPLQPGMQMSTQHQMQLLGSADGTSGLQLHPQMVYVPAGSAQAVTLAGPAGQLTAACQQWQGPSGSNMVYVQQPGGSGYYVTTPSNSSSSNAVVAAGAGAAYSAPMVVTPTMQVVSGSYNGTQPMQIVTAVAADGSITQYPVAAGSIAGPPGMAYAPWYATPGAGSNAVAAQQWGGQAVQQQPQQPQLLSGGGGIIMPPPPQQQQQQPPPPPGQLQLVQVGDHHGVDTGAAGMGPASLTRGTLHNDGFILAGRGQYGSNRGLAGGNNSALDQSYAVVGPAAHALPRSAALVQGQMVQAPLVQSALPGMAGGSAAAPGLVQQGTGGSAQAEAGGAAGNVDDIAHQMAGWHIQ